MMKTILAAGAAAASVLSSAAATPLANWIGHWENSTGEIVSASVSDSGGALSVQIKGKCSPTPCDWGSAPATAYSNSAAVQPAANTQAIIAQFDQGFATKTVVLDGQAGDSLRVHVYTDFTDGSGRADYLLHGALKRRKLVVAPGVVGGPGTVIAPGVVKPVKTFTEDCIPFDPAQITVANPTGSSWKVVQGSMWMLDAGPNRSEMETAKAIIQHYRMNKQCFVGRPDPSLSYWLADDAAPAGAFAGEDCVSINPASLVVEKHGADWTVVSEGNHWAFAAPSEAEANEVIAVVKYYGFTRSCYVGRPGPSMSYLRK